MTADRNGAQDARDPLDEREPDGGALHGAAGDPGDGAVDGIGGSIGDSTVDEPFDGSFTAEGFAGEPLDPAGESDWAADDDVDGVDDAAHGDPQDGAEPGFEPESHEPEPEYDVIPEEHAGMELDEYLCLVYPGVPKGALREEVRAGRVLLDGARVQPSKRVRTGTVVIARIDDRVLVRRRRAQVAPLDVLWESGGAPDAGCAVVDKPPGLAVEPERWDPEGGCVIDALLAWADRRAADDPQAPRFRPRLVHRLDKDTSGALLVAKDIEAERRLAGAFASGHVRKEYLALVEGVPNLEDGEVWTIDLPLAEDMRRAGRVRVDRRRGKPARTDVWIERRFDGYSLLRCRLHTGRTHQIRVHLAESGLPLAIDPLYGRRDAFLLSSVKRGYRPKRGRSERPLMERHTLHADALVFLAEAADDAALAVGPPAIPADLEPGASFSTGPWVGVRAPMPGDLAKVLKQLSKVRPARRRR